LFPEHPDYSSFEKECDAITAIQCIQRKDKSVISSDELHLEIRIQKN
jgi:hypothetical protein